MNGSSTYVLLAWNGNAVPSIEENNLPKHTGRNAFPINFKYGIIGEEQENPPFTPTENPQAPSNQSPASPSIYFAFSLWTLGGLLVVWIL